MSLLGFLLQLEQNKRPKGRMVEPVVKFHFDRRLSACSGISREFHVRRDGFTHGMGTVFSLHDTAVSDVARRR